MLSMTTFEKAQKFLAPRNKKILPKGVRNGYSEVETNVSRIVGDYYMCLTRLPRRMTEK